MLNSFLLFWNPNSINSTKGKAKKAGQLFINYLSGGFNDNLPNLENYTDERFELFVSKSKNEHVSIDVFENDRYLSIFYGDDYDEKVSANAERSLDQFIANDELNLEGIYSSTIIDKVKNRVYTSSDITGIKNPYFGYYNDTLIISSHELLAFSTDCFTDQLNQNAVYEKVAFGWNMSNKGLIEGINKLSGLYIYQFSKNGIEQSNYQSRWLNNLSFSELKDHFYKRFKAQNNLAFELTAGFDSRALLSIALSSRLNFEVNTATTFNKADVSTAQKICKKFNLKHNLLDFDFVEFNKILETAKWNTAISNSRFKFSQSFIEKGVINGPFDYLNKTIIGGEAGGLFKGYYYPDKTIFNWINDFEKTNSFLAKKVVKNNLSVLGVDSQELYKNSHYELLQAISAQCENMADVLDIYFVLEQANGFFPNSDFNWIKKYTPFFNRNLISFARLIVPDSRSNKEFHKMAFELNPALNRIPFNGKKSNRLLEYLSTRKKPRINLWAIKKTEVLNEFLTSKPFIDFFETDHFDQFLSRQSFLNLIENQKFKKRIDPVLDQLITIQIFSKNMQEIKAIFKQTL